MQLRREGVLAAEMECIAIGVQVRHPAGVPENGGQALAEY